ncbi:MAG: hypothetical protein IPM42_00785 [Saprospiraceae bacterium]|nr:hypothetical protein [Saprospiraceae bacterium]
MKSIIFPFHINIDPMARLLLVNFEKDPDSLYIGFEPQVFDDETNGKGHLVIGWRKDGKVDVYHEPTLLLNPEKYDIAGKGLANMRMTNFETNYFIINEFGVQAHYAFKDLMGREIELEIAEKNNKTRKPFDLLAPMGDAAENPSSMPLVMLFDFYFVRKKHTDFKITISGKNHHPDTMPLPMDGTGIYYTRYSPKPLIVTLNPKFNGVLHPIHKQHLEQIISVDQNEIFINEVDGILGVTKIKIINPIAPFEMHFDPPFPDIQSIQANSNLKGKFKINSKPEIGYVSGTYAVKRNDNRINILLNPSGGWKPKPSKFVLRFLYFVAKPFKNWPKTYQWEADILVKDDVYFMESDWKRI